MFDINFQKKVGTAQKGRKKERKDLLWIVPVSGYPLGHVGVTPHEISHELLGVDIRS